jgi:hypothetical protein
MAAVVEVEGGTLLAGAFPVVVVLSDVVVVVVELDEAVNAPPHAASGIPAKKIVAM